MFHYEVTDIAWTAEDHEESGFCLPIRETVTDCKTNDPINNIRSVLNDEYGFDPVSFKYRPIEDIDTYLRDYFKKLSAGSKVYPELFRCGLTAVRV